MKTNASVLSALTLMLLTSVPAVSQQVTGTPGAPGATTTIPGDQLPAPPQTFEGVINDTAQESKPYWPMRIVPPQGAPNVLLIITDDAGYGVPSTFGVSFRHRRSTASRMKACATRISTPPPCALPREPPSSPDAITTRPATA